MKDCPKLQALCDFLKDRHAMEDDCFYELLERIRNSDGYCTFQNIRQAYEWVKEKQSEAAEAQWNRELILLREIQTKIKEIAKDSDDLISLEDAVKMLLEDVDALDSRTLNNLKSIQILKHITKLDNERME
jgi:hypothetical protein